MAEELLVIQPEETGGLLPYPWFIAKDGQVGRQDFWRGTPAQLVGFVYDPTTTGEVDLEFDQFWADCNDAVGMFPVFAHADGTFATYGHRRIASVRAEGSDALFDVPPVPPATPKKKSGDRRRAERQAQALRHGGHPLGVALRLHLPLHTDAAPVDDRAAAGLRCGGCRFRRSPMLPTSRRYPKCSHGGDDWPRATHGAGTDVAAWWPACRDFQAVTR